MLAQRRHFVASVLPLLIILAGFAVRVVGLQHSSLWLDELIQVTMASKPMSQILQNMFDHVNLPVDIFLSRGMLALGGQDGWLRLAPALAGTLSLPLIYAVARKLVAPPAPLLSMALLAFSPLAVHYSRELRPYSVLMMLTLFSVLLFLRALERPHNWPFFIIAALLTLHTHLFALAMLPVFGLFALIWLMRPGPGAGRRWTRFLPLASVGLVFLLYLLSPFTPDYVGRVGTSVLAGLVQVDSTELQASAQVRYPFPGWAVLFSRLPYDFTGRFAGIALAGALRAFGLALAALALLNIRRRPRSGSFLLLWLLLIPAAILAILSQRNHWYSPRYIIQALPAGLILVGAGMAQVGSVATRWWQRGGQRGGRPAALAIAAVLALYLLLLTPSLVDVLDDTSENIRDAAAYIRQHYQPGDLVVAPVIGRYLDHYLPSEIPRLDTNSPVVVESEGRNYERVFVMMSQYGLLRAANPPWINPDNLLAIFDPDIELYRGPAGEVAAALIDQRLAEVQTSSAATSELPVATLRQLAAEARAVGDWEAAGTYLESAVARLPEEADLWIDLGFARQMRGDFAAAISAYDEAIRLQPESAWAHLLAANSYRRMGDPAAGLPYAERAAALAPNLDASWIALGYIQGELDRPVGAVASFERAIALQPDDLASWFGYARALTALAAPGWREAWLRVLELDPEPDMVTEACQYLDSAAHPACLPSP